LSKLCGEALTSIAAGGSNRTRQLRVVIRVLCALLRAAVRVSCQSATTAGAGRCAASAVVGLDPPRRAATFKTSVGSHGGLVNTARSAHCHQRDGRGGPGERRLGSIRPALAEVTSPVGDTSRAPLLARPRRRARLAAVARSGTSSLRCSSPWRPHGPTARASAGRTRLGRPGCSQPRRAGLSVVFTRTWLFLQAGIGICRSMGRPLSTGRATQHFRLNSRACPGTTSA
jgi:hypothetical protein